MTTSNSQDCGHAHRKRSGSIRKHPEASGSKESEHVKFAGLRPQKLTPLALGSIMGNELNDEARQALQRAVEGRDVKIDF